MMGAGPIRTLLVDDEPLARRRLRTLLAKHDGFAVVGEAADGEDALAQIAARRPDLVLLDVQMPGLDGLAVAARANGPRAPLFVFVTAFDRFAASAFDLDAADYLLKPYDPDRFAAALVRVRRRLDPGVADPPVPLDHLVAVAAGQVRLIPVALIKRIDAAGNYVEVTTAGGGRQLVRGTLAALAAQLPTGLVRVHRSTIVRADRVVRIESAGHGDARIVLADAAAAPLSRRYRRQFLDRIAELRSR